MSGNTPAKKAVPSLSDLTKKKDDETQKVNNDNLHDENKPNETNLRTHEETKKDAGLSPAVTSTVPNKTPAELSAESPKETAERYGIDNTLDDTNADDPRIQRYRE